MAAYLLNHKSSQWTWNYWERGSGSRPYPDDLDDTACAVVGLLANDPSCIDAAGQALLARALISCETQPGGPYRTWVTSLNDIAWRDVDVVVNANIGGMLDVLGVHSRPLETYISQCIESGELQSPYYVGSVPSLYFIARWYRGPQLPRLRQLIIAESHTARSAMHRAMLVTAACATDCWTQLPTGYVSALLAMQHDGAWPAKALYYEPPQGGSQQYAGSPELTTAFAIEALSSWLAIKPATKSKPPVQASSLRAIHQQAVKQMVRSDVADAAGIMARSLGENVSKLVLRRLNTASRNGWVAYTRYDALLDEHDASQLGVANSAMRQALRYYQQALPNNKVYAGYIESVFSTMDAANMWEITHARSAHKPPDYKQYRQLAQRSWGHVLAPTGVLLAVGFELHSKEVRMFHGYMRHYIIARQLVDDAHDWQDDLAHGRMTSVVTMLLVDCASASMFEMQQHYWNTTILAVNTLIRHHVQQARRYLAQCDYLIDTAQYLSWLQGLERVCDRAEVGIQQTQLFITAFTSNKMVN